jgi:hypothetical protein
MAQKTWSVEDVAKFLHRNYYASLVPKFRANNIDGEKLLSMTLEDMEALGLSPFVANEVYSFAHRAPPPPPPSAPMPPHVSLQVDGSTPVDKSWSVEDVANFLHQTGRAEFKLLAPVFRQQRIDGSRLVNMSRADLEGLGLSTLLAEKVVHLVRHGAPPEPKYVKPDASIVVVQAEDEAQGCNKVLYKTPCGIMTVLVSPPSSAAPRPATPRPNATPT